MPSTVHPGVNDLSGSVRNVSAEATELDKTSSKVAVMRVMPPSDTTEG